MTKRERPALPFHPATPVELRLRLYIAAGSPNSARALANLQAICREYLDNVCQVEVIDVFESPLRALGDGILMTPTLVRAQPQPAVQIVGDLSDTERVLQALEVARDSPEVG